MYSENKKNHLIIKKLAGGIIFSMLFTSMVFSQKTEISGTTTDQKGLPLPGVNILEKGTQNGVSSDFDGNFKIQVESEENLLIFSYIGFKSIEKKASLVNNSIVSLSEDLNNLDEVVVIGYGQSSKRDLTGSVSGLKSEEIQDLQLPSVTQALQGRVTGVQLTESSGEPGAAISVRIRGVNTLGNDTEPLYVIDGIPLSLGGEAAAEEFAASSNPLATLNPNDIQSIQVLKDASAAAIYGSRASNGVVIITTKSGASDKLSINFSARSYMQDYFEDNKLMNGIQIAQARNEQLSLLYPTQSRDELIQQEILPYIGEAGSFTPLPEVATIGTNWYDSVLRQAFGQNYQFTVSGKSNNSSHVLSTNFDNQDGVIINSNFKRYNIRYNLEHDFSEKIKLVTSTRYNTIRNNRSQTGTRTATRGVINWARRIDPNIPLRNDLGGITQEDDNGNFLVNPFIEATEVEDITLNQDLNLSAKLLLQLAPGLDWNIRTGLDLRDSERYSFYPFVTTVGRNANGQYTGSELKHEHFTAETFLDYKVNFGPSKISNLGLVLGVSTENFKTFTEQNRITNFTFDNLGVDALQLGQERVFTNTLREESSLESVFARLNFNHDGKYLITLTGRADGSSRFVEGNQWSFFPSTAVAWNIHRENFLKESTVLNQLKLRASYGLTGNQAIQPYATLSQFGIGASVFADSGFYTSTFPANIANQDLTWSTTTQTNFGLDFGLFNGRLSVTADYYFKDTQDLLLNQLIPPSSGFGTVATNLGSLENEGFEVNLNLGIVENDKFQWQSNLNFSRNRTLITSLGDNEFIDGANISANFLNFPANRTIVGEEPGTFFGWEVDGLIQTSDLTDYANGDFTIGTNADGSPKFVADNGITTPGYWKYVDQLTVDTDDDGIPDQADGIINEDDRVILGNPNPDFTFGWSNDFRIGKRFSVNLFFQGSYGNDILNASGIFTNYGFTTYNNTEEWFEKRWTLNNQHNDPKFPSGLDLVRPTNISVEDGSYIRLKNAVVRYNLPVEDKLGVNMFQLYLSATNVFTLTNYSGPDPEVSTFGDSPLEAGVDYNSYPRSRLIAIGFNIQL